jgi:hypothetical protein
MTDAVRIAVRIETGWGEWRFSRFSEPFPAPPHPSVRSGSIAAESIESDQSNRIG